MNLRPILMAGAISAVALPAAADCARSSSLTVSRTATPRRGAPFSRIRVRIRAR